MVRPRLIALLIAIVAPSFWSAASAVPPTEPKQWSFGVGTPMVGDFYELRNLVNGRPLKGARREGNPQLAWGEGRHWRISPYSANSNVRDHRTRPVVSGQVYHLTYSSPRGEPGGYFAIGTTNTGWGPPLRPVRYRLEIDPATGNTAIFSVDAGDYLVYNPRKSGFQLDLLARMAASQFHTASVWLTAQPPIQGFVPFLGRWGGGVNFSAVLTEVRNIPGGPQLWFIRPGFSSQQCGNPQAVIPLAPGRRVDGRANDDSLRFGHAEPQDGNPPPRLRGDPGKLGHRQHQISGHVSHRKASSGLCAVPPHPRSPFLADFAP